MIDLKDTTNKYKFSFFEYNKIIKTFSKRFTSFPNAIGKEKFVILRHDVEFSVSRALELAKIEHEANVKSTFFFQVISNAYNPFSVINYNNIQNIKKMGHDVGLHFYASHIKNPSSKNIRIELDRQKLIFEKGLDIACTIFSFHRPPLWALELNDDIIGGIINAYGPSFFEFSPKPKNIKYFSDSNLKWKYGHPLDHISENKIQILAHPDEWTLSGSKSDKDFFLSIERDHYQEFKETLDNEMKNYSEVMNKS